MKEHTYKPLPRELTIMKSPIHGLGLFVDPDLNREYPILAKGQLIGVTHISSNVLPDDLQLEVIDIANDRHSLIKMQREDLFANGLIRTPLGGFINHKTESNVDFKYLGDGLWGIIASRDIYSGEEITIDYKTTPCGVIKESE